MKELDIINGSFEQGWDNFPPAPGDLINQKPKKWDLSWIKPGDPLYSASDIANGVPECVHKLNNQLPDHEKRGGRTPLILHGDAVYKIFHANASFGADLFQNVSGLKAGSAGRLIVPVQIHRHGDGDIYAAEIGIFVTGEKVKGAWHQPEEKKWYEYTVPFTVNEDGMVQISIYVKSKWNKPKDFFLDNIRLYGVLNDDLPPDDDDDEPPSNDDHTHDDLTQEIGLLRQDVDVFSDGVKDLSDKIAALTQMTDDLDERIRALENRDDDDDDAGMLYGIDVSYHQGKMDWEKARPQIDFAGVRVTVGFWNGGGKIDDEAQRNIEETQRLGIPTYPYHYLSVEQNWHNQAEMFVDFLRENHTKISGIPVVDIESPHTTISNEQVRENVFMFLDYVHKQTGVLPMIYTGAWWWNSIGFPQMHYPLWVADHRGRYTNADPILPLGWDDWAIWQYSAGENGGNKLGSQYGAKSANIDLNIAPKFLAANWNFSEQIIDDIAEYILPHPFNWDGYGDILITENNWNEGQERVQIQYDSESELYYITKGTQWEKYAMDDYGIYLLMDTSRNSKEYYTNDDIWLARQMAIKETVQNNGTTKVYRKNDCVLIASYVLPSRMRLDNQFERWVDPNTGRAYNDVIKVSWVVKGVVDESHYFARGIGRVRWEKMDGRYSAVVEIIPSTKQDPNVRIPIPCHQVQY